LGSSLCVEPVTNMNPNYAAGLVQSITGNTGNCFNYLEDALAKAYEWGAPYQYFSITIKMTPG
jgi:type IV secretory pathway VirB6-like protein